MTELKRRSRHPTVSIVIATLNAGSSISDCLQSIRGQTSDDYEVLVSDGGSSDETLERVLGFGPQFLLARSEPDRGIYDAWNQVLESVRGEWVLFFGADDVFSAPNVLAEALSAMEASKSRSGFVAFPAWLTGPRERIIFKSAAGLRDCATRGEMCFAHPTTFHHTSLFTSFGRFDPTYRVAGDLEFALRARSAPMNSCHAPILAKLGGHGVSVSPQLVSLRQREILRARRAHGFQRIGLELSLRMAYERLLAYRSRNDAKQRNDALSVPSRASGAHPSDDAR